MNNDKITKKDRSKPHNDKTTKQDRIQPHSDETTFFDRQLVQIAPNLQLPVLNIAICGPE